MNSRTETTRAASYLAAIIAFFATVGPTRPVVAHEVTQELVVQMFVQPQSERLTVLLRVPTALLADAGLPRSSDGRLDVAALPEPLRLVAADVADTLEVRQADVTLSRPKAIALVSPSSDLSFATFSSALTHLRSARQPAESVTAEAEAFVDLELVYAVEPGSKRVSARLNAFRAQGQQVRTVAQYVLPDGQRTFTMSGPAERVIFDPDRSDVVRPFVARGLQALLDGESLLLLLCLILPVRRAGQAAVLVAMAVLGQLVTGVLSAAVPLSSPLVAVTTLVAASMVVVAAMQNIAGAALRLVALLALGFGLFSGFAFGHDIAIAGQFAGAHVALATLIFLLVAALAQLWIGTLLWLIRRWLDERGLPDRAATIVASALIAHSGVHRMLERGGSLEVDSGRALVLLTLGWAAAILLVGLVHAVYGRARLFGDLPSAQSLG